MRVILMILLIILAAFVVLAVGGGLLALLAFGLGRLLNLLMQIEPFQATIISLVSICIFGILAERAWRVVANPPAPVDEDFDYDDDEFFDDDEEDDDEPLVYPGVPRWRQPLKNIDFSNARPEDRCPCGSGRKYKNCHGMKKN